MKTLKLDNYELKEISLVRIHPVLDAYALRIIRDLGLQKAPLEFYKVDFNTPPGYFIGGFTHIHEGIQVVGLNYKMLDLKQNSMLLTESIAHELKHAQQMQQGRLKLHNLKKGIYEWEGKIVDLSKVPYRSRGFEIEAHAYGTSKAVKLKI
jgi:hypothetical protein